MTIKKNRICFLCLSVSRLTLKRIILIILFNLKNIFSLGVKASGVISKGIKTVSKLKTKSSVKKRFRLTASGKIKMGKAGRRHGMSKRSNKMLRDSRGPAIMFSSDAKKVKDYYFHV